MLIYMPSGIHSLRVGDQPLIDCPIDLVFIVSTREYNPPETQPYAPNIIGEWHSNAA